MQEKRMNWKEIIDKRRKENFVGRSDYLSYFSNNLHLEVPAFLLFSVTGEGGVGKSTLLNQFENIINGPSIRGITILCDDRQLSTVDVMGHVAEKLGRLGIKKKEFDERHKTYCARREEIESDPKAPRGALNLVVRGMTDFAIKAARRSPGVGVFAEYLNEKEAGEALTQGVAYLIDRFTNKDEIQLLRGPEKILTPLFIGLLNDACMKHHVVLMFDVFERTYEALEPWLLECLSFKYGECDSNLSFVISGRDQLDQHWTEIASSICHITLEPFTGEETGLYLANRRITEESLITQIHEDTGGLPVLVELLAGTNPKPGLPLPDISKDAVKRFLQWIPEEDRRRVALLAAVPRQFNLDTLSACFGSDAGSLFNWLSGQSYIRRGKKRGWFYHEKVRELMLRYLHNTTPSDLEIAHKRMVHFFEERQQQLSVDDSPVRGREWQRLEVERVYHLLSEQPVENIGRAVNAFLSASGSACAFGNSIPQACHQVGREVVSQEVQEWARKLDDFYKACERDEHESLVRLANLLAERNDLDPKAQYSLLARRAETYRLMGKYSEALMDFDRAITLSEGCYALVHRGKTYLKMGDYEKALSDFTLTSTNWQCSLAFSQRGETYRLMGKYSEALADFDRAIELDGASHWSYEQRGILLRDMERYEEAVKSLTEADKIVSDCPICVAQRGETYRLMGKYSEALADFDRAIELDGASHWSYEQRGILLRDMERYEEAVKSLTEADKIDSDCPMCVAERGETYRLMGKYSEALVDFDRAIELDTQYYWAYRKRGILLRDMKRYEEAVKSLTEADGIHPDSPLCSYEIGLTHRLMGEYSKALADFDKAFALNEKSSCVLAWRGEMHRRLGNYDLAIADLSRAIELDPESANFPRSRRAAVYLATAAGDAASSDISSVKQSPSEGVADLYNKAIVFCLSGHASEAVDLLKKAIESNLIALHYARNDDLFEPLKSMREFQELMNE